MNIADVTIAQFKSQYPNGLMGYPYLPTWDPTKTYNINDKVFLNDIFYKCILSNINQTPPNPTFWAVYSDNINLYITDGQITNGFIQAQISFPTEIFCTDNDVTITYVYCMLVAHYITAFGISQGLIYQGQQASTLGVINSQTVGNVSISTTIPSSITGSIGLIGLNSTIYGQQYLQIVEPKSIGFMGYSYGAIAD